MSSPAAVSAASRPAELERKIKVELAGGTPFFSAASRTQIVAVFILLGVVLMAATAGLGTLVVAPVAAYLSSTTLLAWGAGVGAGVGFVLTVVAIIIARLRIYKEPQTDYRRFPQPTTFGADHIYSCQTPEETQKASLELIRNAKEFVKYSGNFCGGLPFRSKEGLLGAVEEAFDKSEATHGKGKAIFTAQIIASAELLEPADRAALKVLQKKMGRNLQVLIPEAKLRFYDRPGKWLPGVNSVELHTKLLVVDGEVSSFGGTNRFQTNLSRSIAPAKATGTCAEKFKYKMWTGGAMDADLFVTGSAVAVKYSEEFDALWNSWADRIGQPRINTLPIKEKKLTRRDYGQRGAENVGITPLFSSLNQGDQISAKLVECINATKKTITLANMCFNPQGHVRDALIDAAARGVKIRVITNGIHPGCPTSVKGFAKGHFQHYYPVMIGRAKIDPKQKVEKRYVEIYHYTRRNVMMHKKVWVFDDTDVVYSNANLSSKSTRDSELGAHVRSRAIARETLEGFESDLKECVVLTIEQAKASYNSFQSKFQNNLVSPIAP